MKLIKSTITLLVFIWGYGLLAEGAISIGDLISKYRPIAPSLKQLDHKDKYLEKAELRFSQSEDRSKELVLRFRPQFSSEIKANKIYFRALEAAMNSEQIVVEQKILSRFWQNIFLHRRLTEERKILLDQRIIVEKIITYYEAHPGTISEKPEKYIELLKKQSELVEKLDATSSGLGVLSQWLNSIMDAQPRQPDPKTIATDDMVSITSLMAEKIKWMLLEPIAFKTNEIKVELARGKYHYEASKENDWLSYVDLGTKINDKNESRAEISFGISLPFMVQSSWQLMDDYRNLINQENLEKTEREFLNVQLKIISAQIDEKFKRLSNDSSMLKKRLGKIGASHAYGIQSALQAEEVLHEVALREISIEADLYQNFVELCSAYGLLRFDGFPFLKSVEGR